MIMLDEFNRLGKMPIVLDSIETLRSYRANLAIVTQTIPALDEIYGENARRALQGNAGIKLYLTPSDEKTIEELSKAVGKTTKRVVTRSRSVGRNPFAGRSMSERTEETALLPEDEARRMDLDDIVLVVDAQMPVRTKRIKYYEDRFFKQIFDKQSGDLPYPSAGDQMRGLQGQIKTLEAKVGALEMPSGVSASDLGLGVTRRTEIYDLSNAKVGSKAADTATSMDYRVGVERVDAFLKVAGSEETGND